MLMSCLEWHSHNLHLETCVCVCVCSCQCLVGRNGRTFLAIKERHISIIIQMSSKSTLKVLSDEEHIMNENLVLLKCTFGEK